MKFKLFAVTALLSLSAISAASSSLMEVAEAISNADANVNGISMNRDGSVTFHDITVQRGDMVYRVSVQDGSTDAYTAVCRMMGFDTKTEGPELNTYANERGTKAVLNADGTFSMTRTYDYYVKKLTCHKSGSLKTIVDFDREKNTDGSSKITNLTIVRGDLSYRVSVEGGTAADYTNACRLLGFASSLTGEGLNTYSNISGTKVVLNTRGEVDSFKAYDYTINKLTCYSGAEPTLIVYVGGTRYTRIIP